MKIFYITFLLLFYSNLYSQNIDTLRIEYNQGSYWKGIYTKELLEFISIQNSNTLKLNIFEIKETRIKRDSFQRDTNFKSQYVNLDSNILKQLIIEITDTSRSISNSNDFKNLLGEITKSRLKTVYKKYKYSSFNFRIGFKPKKLDSDYIEDLLNLKYFEYYFEYLVKEKKSYSLIIDGPIKTILIGLNSNKSKTKIYQDLTINSGQPYSFYLNDSTSFKVLNPRVNILLKKMFPNKFELNNFNQLDAILAGYIYWYIENGSDYSIKKWKESQNNLK